LKLYKLFPLVLAVLILSSLSLDVFGSSSGPNNGNTFGQNMDVGTVYWVNPSNAQTSNNVYAYADLVNYEITTYLTASNFGFSIPAGAHIDGIKVEVEKSCVITGGTGGDFEAKILKGGLPLGNDKALAGDWPATDNNFVYGGATDLWGLSWLASDINAIGFGFALSGQKWTDGDGIRLRVDWIKITVYYTINSAPTNDALTLDLTGASYKGTKTLLTAKQDYKFVYKCSDADGVTDISYAEIRLDYATKNVILRATRGTGDAWTFSEQSDPSNYVTLNTGGSSHSTSGTQKTFNFLVKINWNWDDASETLGVRAYVVDAAPTSDQDDYTNIFGVENDLSASSLVVNDYRCNPSQTLTFTGYWYYEGTSIAPPDGNYAVVIKLSSTQKGSTDTTLVSGAFSISDVTAESSVNSYSYTVEATYMASAGSFSAVIVDRIKVSSYSVSDSRANVNDNVNIDATLVYEYSSAAITTGTITINGYSASHQGSGVYRITRTSASVTSVTYNTVAGSESTYGLTTVNQNSQSTTVIWDRLTVNYKAVDDSRRDISTSGEVRFKLRSEYDSAFVQAGTVSVNGSSASWDSGNSWWKLSVSQSSVCLKDYIVTAVSWSTYSITALNSGVSTNSTAIIWDRIIVNYKAVDDDRRDISTSGEVRFRLRSEYDSAFVTAGSVSVNGSAASWDAGNGWWKIPYTLNAVGIRYFIVDFVSWSTYGITALNSGISSNSTSIIWDRLIISAKGNNATLATVLGDPIRVEFKLRSEYDSAFVQAGSLSVNGSAATWDAVNSWWCLDVVAPIPPDLVSYVVTSSSWSTYGITALNAGIATNATSFASGGWIEVTLTVVDNRIDVSSNVSITVLAVYGWNSTPCSLSAFALNDTTTKDIVGIYGFKVNSLTESPNGITTFASNSLYVIFDRVEGLLNLTGGVSHRIDAGSNATILFPQLWYAFDHAALAGSLTLNDTTTKTTPGRYGYEIASVTDSLYNLTGFTTNSTYVIFDAMNVTGVTFEGFDSSGNVRLKPVVKSAYDGSAFTGYVDINGTKGQSGATVAVPFSATGCLIIRGWNDTTYGLTRALVNSSWLVYLSKYKVTSKENKTMTALYLALSDLLQIIASNATVQIKCPAPYIVQIDGVAKAPGDKWHYIAATGVLELDLTASWANVYYSAPSSGGSSSGESSGGGMPYPIEVVLPTTFLGESKTIKGSSVYLILTYAVDNTAQRPIAEAWLLMNVPSQYSALAWDAVYEGQKKLMANATSQGIKTQVFNVTYPDSRRVDVMIDYTAKVGNPYMAVWNILGMKITFGHLIALLITIPILLFALFWQNKGNIWLIIGDVLLYTLLTILIFHVDLVPLALLPSSPDEWSAWFSSALGSVLSGIYSFLDTTIYTLGPLRLNLFSGLVVVIVGLGALILKARK